ncbi:MAG: hypothetical protein HY550_06095 [Elusimicrobia bacterium]|nr:hypothetical protein [Elusimicrobiota bacterium]
MTNKDKMIAAFLVSVGVFSGVQASQYVSTLNTKEKKVLLPVAKAKDGKILLCSGVESFIKTDGDGTVKSV